MDVEEFIRRWQPSGGSERANFQQFAIELTQLLSVDAPKPATADSQNDDYRYERPVTFIHTGTQSRGFIDLYRRKCFVMEAKLRVPRDDGHLFHGMTGGHSTRRRAVIPRDRGRV